MHDLSQLEKNYVFPSIKCQIFNGNASGERLVLVLVSERRWLAGCTVSVLALPGKAALPCFPRSEGMPGRLAAAWRARASPDLAVVPSPVPVAGLSPLPWISSQEQVPVKLMGGFETDS